MVIDGMTYTTVDISTQLYQSGHEVGRYISLERIINDTHETYFEALGRSTDGWHDGQHLREAR